MLCRSQRCFYMNLILQDSINVKELPQGTPENSQTESFANTAEKFLGEAKDSVNVSLYSSKVNHWPIKVDSFLMPKAEEEYVVNVSEMPHYYKETFFSKDSLVIEDAHAGRYGIAGDPLPYSLRTDDFITSILIVGILLLMLSIKRTSRFFSFQMKHFFRTTRENSILERESASQLRYLIFMEMHTAVILSLVFYFYAKENISETYITLSEYTLMGCFLGVVMLLIGFEHSLQTVVNNIFFSATEQRQWKTAKMMLMASMGILLTPMLLLLAYFGLSVNDTLLYTVFVVLFVKILLFYKCFKIFFKKKSAFLQIFLYFCTLEINPMLVAWGILVFIANFLKVNY